MIKLKIKTTKRIILITALAVLLSISSAIAENIEFTAKLEMSRVSAGNPIYLYVTLKGAQDADKPETPTIDGLKIKYIGPTSEMSIVNSAVSRSITFTYLVIPIRDGEYDIGPFFTEYRGVMYKADPVKLYVSNSLTSTGKTSSPYTTPQTSSYTSETQQTTSSGTPYVGDKLFLMLDLKKRTLYINEIVPITVKVYVEGMGLKDIEYPTYPHEGFSVGEFQKPERKRENVRGIRYDVLEFRQNIFGIKEGNYTLGPAALNCKMITRSSASRRSSIFGVSVFTDDAYGFGYKTYPVELESEEVAITILPLPEKGRPSDFHGAVGNFDLTVEVSPKDIKVGDPVTLNMTIRGEGNLDTVTAPQIEINDQFKTYEPQVTKRGTSKIYEQVIIPKTDKLKEIPAVSFSFFNPETERYETIQKGPFPIKVSEQPEVKSSVKMVAMPETEHMFYPEEKLGQDIIYIKDNIGTLRSKGYFLYDNWFFKIGQLIPLFLLLGLYSWYRKRERIMTDRGYARSLKAPRAARSGLTKAKAYLNKNEIALFYDNLYKTLQGYLGNRFNLPKGNISVQNVEDRLKHIGFDKSMMEILNNIFTKCEMARYASSLTDKPEAEEMFENTKKLIDYLEKIRL